MNLIFIKLYSKSLKLNNRSYLVVVQLFLILITFIIIFETRPYYDTINDFFMIEIARTVFNNRSFFSIT